MMLGQRLQDIRTEHDMSQEELAEALNISRQTVSRWERDVTQPSADHLAVLSELFGLPVDAFLKDDWEPPDEAEPAVMEVPVKVPVSAPRHYRLWPMLAAVLVVAGIVIGVILYRGQSEESVSINNLEGEVIDIPLPGGLDMIPITD